MQFMNIIVHSVQDMNYRVYLQEEFKLLGLDECLKVREEKFDGFVGEWREWGNF